MDHERNEREIERKLNELLTEGEIAQERAASRGRNRIFPPYEIRVQTERDPIVEETQLYRRMAEEVDDRYDRYMEMAKRDGARSEEES